MNATRLRSTLRALASLALIGAAPPAAAEVKSGTLLGEFTVGASGDAQYAIPLDVPPGVAGMEPVLGLAYGSFTGNGPLGGGWAPPGLPSITRCKAVPYADGFRGAIGFDPRDRYCLDGQRLVDTAGRYGQAGLALAP